MFSPGEASCHTTFPVVLFTARKLGALGAGIFSWFSVRPFDVPTNTRSSQTAGDEFAMLCGKTPSSLIMSSFQTMSASVGPFSFSSW